MSQAVELTYKHRPAIVLVDVVLPDGDGMQDAQQLKGDPSLGLRLVSDLARQLLGTLDVGRDATFTITFSRACRTGAIPRPGPTRSWIE